MSQFFRGNTVQGGPSTIGGGPSPCLELRLFLLPQSRRGTLMAHLQPRHSCQFRRWHSLCSGDGGGSLTACTIVWIREESPQRMRSMTDVSYAHNACVLYRCRNYCRDVPRGVIQATLLTRGSSLRQIRWGKQILRLWIGCWQGPD